MGGAGRGVGGGVAPAGGPFPYTSSFFLPLLNASPYQTAQDKAAVGSAGSSFQIFVNGVYYQRAERTLAAVDFFRQCH